MDHYTYWPVVCRILLGSFLMNGCYACEVPFQWYAYRCYGLEHGCETLVVPHMQVLYKLARECTRPG